MKSKKAAYLDVAFYLGDSGRRVNPRSGPLASKRAYEFAPCSPSPSYHICSISGGLPRNLHKQQQPLRTNKTAVAVLVKRLGM